MATFLSNITDVFPQPALYTPDFDRVSRMLYQRENLYRQGAQKVKSLYESALNSDLTRDGNVERRDAYLKTIDQNLKDLAASDLSVPSNVDAANRFFEPVFSDKDMVHDILWTRGYNNEVSKAESMRTSTDPTTRKQYWDIGARALQYQKEEYKNADNKSALTMTSPKYTSHVDMLSYADKLYKEAGIKVKQDDIKGGYIVTRQNGDVAVPVTKQFVDMMMASDPAIGAMLQTQAYVQRKDFMKQNAAKYGSEEQAEMAYISNVLQSVDAVNQATADKDTDDMKENRAKVDNWNNIITTRGIIPGSDEHKQYLADMGAAEDSEKVVNTKKNLVLHPSMIDKTNLFDMRAAADRAMYMANAATMGNKLTGYLAYKNAEVSAKADPFALAKFNQQAATSRAMALVSAHLQAQKNLLQWKKDNGFPLGGSSNSKQAKKDETDQASQEALNKLLTPGGMYDSKTFIQVPETENDSDNDSDSEDDTDNDNGFENEQDAFWSN